MPLHPDLARDLASLSRAVDAPGDLAVTLQGLADSASASVPSYVGLTLLLHRPATSSTTDSAPLTMTFLDDDGSGEDRELNEVDVVIRSSLLLPLAPTAAPDPMGGPPLATGWWTVQIVLYAAARGAFVDMAADLSWLQGTPLGDVVLDEHLSPDLGSQSTSSAMTRASQTDQALGVLLAGGLTLTQAEGELGVLAARDDLDLVTAAERLLLDL